MEVVFNDVSFSYDNNKVFDKFSCCLSSGIINAVIGATGTGKSTMLDLIDGLIECDNGYIKIGSYKNNSIRRSIGYLFQFPEDQIFNSNVYTEIEFGLKCFKCDDIDSKIRESIKLVGLDESYLSLNPYKLSNGERRKVAFASILAYDPDILILDEPTVGLDNKSKSDLIKLLRVLKKDYGKTIIIVSHDMNFLLKFVDYVYLLRNGSIFLEGDKYSVLSNEDAMTECGLCVPNILCFSNLVLKKKNIKIGYRDEINDLIKDVYRYAKW